MKKFSLGIDGLLGKIGPDLGSVLAKRFNIVPFSVLRTYSKDWGEQKRKWLALGIQGASGRFEANGAQSIGLSDSCSSYITAARSSSDPYSKIAKSKRGKNAFAIGNKTEYENGGTPDTTSGTSIFDPVLCELVYRWFCPPGGRCLDPFCGGSTNGIVGTALGYRFTGIDTRPEQIAANIPQAERLGLSPKWICGDSEKIDDLISENRMFDLIWTDPPYFDLETYGGVRNDGSMHRTFPDFLKWYRRVFSVCVERLKENRFAAIKVGEVRGKDGAYLNFVGETIKTFTRLGLHYYNEIILVTAAGSLPIRTSKQFQSSRKIGKTHQNVLVFWKGDPREIKTYFSKIRIGDEQT